MPDRSATDEFCQSTSFDPLPLVTITGKQQILRNSSTMIIIPTLETRKAPEPAPLRVLRLAANVPAQSHA